MNGLMAPMYESMKNRRIYDQFPDYYRDRLRPIIAQLQEYSGLVLDVIITAPLEAPALSHAPNVVKIAPSIIVLDIAVVAQIMAHEFGHHVHGHVYKPTGKIESEYQADSFSVGFLQAYGYDLQVAKAYRMNMLNPTGCKDCVEPQFHIMQSMVEKEFDAAIKKPMSMKKSS